MAEAHSGASGRIEHPCRRHPDDYAGRYLDVNDLATGAAFDILATNAAPIVCVLRIELDLLPGRGCNSPRVCHLQR
jgi:hypothetical protein